jgi:hypothetical protein
VLKRRLDDAAQTSTWQAHDETLERSVHLRAIAADHPHVEAVLDAARRAAAVEDARLVRILDVGVDDDATFVVSEWLTAPSLEEQLADGGPLAPGPARVVVGESALALEAARHRGLHHLRLTPGRVHLMDDGTVKVTELATAAALDGAEVAETDSAGEEATRRDARDLIALAYAVLTGHWPLKVGSGLPPAPQVAGKPVAPGQIVTGVPADLDTLCAQTFAGAGAPDSPSDLAGQIAPWGRQRAQDRSGGAFPHALPPVPRAGLPTAPPPAAPRATAPRPVAPPVAAPITPPALAPVAASPTAPPPAVAQPVAAQPVAAQPVPQSPAREPVALASLGLGYGPDEPPPSVGSDRDDGRSERHPAVVLALVGGFVVIFLLLAYCGLRGLGDNAFVPAAQPSPSATQSPTSTPTETSTPDETSTPTATSGPISVTATRGFDPQGDGSEKDSIAGKATDGNPSTSWTSDTYKSAAFGGLKKGVGLLVDLGGEHEVTSVQVKLGADGGAVELRGVDGEKLGQKLAQADDASGTITLEPTQPVTASELVVWFTSLPQADGGYRAVVDEVTVK